MIVNKIIESNKFTLINEGDDLTKEVTSVFCCDLLSIAMSRANQGCAWVTVMANVNTIAVGSLVDVSCIILAEGTVFDKPALEKAIKEGLTVFSTDMPIFESAKFVAELLDD